MEPTTTSLLVPLGTIAAALIAGSLSFLNLVISKEQKVSEFRQAWIDKLREDISKYVGATSFIASAHQLWVTEKVQKPSPSLLDYHRTMQVPFDAASQAFTSIVLRINPSDSDKYLKQKNEEFLSTLRAVRDAMRDDKYNEARKLADTLQEKAQPILKFEWDRVKNGERFYRITRRIPASILAVGFLAGLIYGSIAIFRANQEMPTSAEIPANPPMKLKP